MLWSQSRQQTSYQARIWISLFRAPRSGLFDFVVECKRHLQTMTMRRIPNVRRLQQIFSFDGTDQTSTLSVRYATFNNRRSFSSKKESLNCSDRVTVTKLETGIVRVELNRPEKRNALDIPMFEAIAQTAAELREDKSVRAVVLCGNGKSFCSGLDVKSVLTKGNPLKTISHLLERPSGYGRKALNDGDHPITAVGNLAQDVGYLWRSLSVPVIASLHGICFGGGLQIALGADMRFCDRDCRFSIMEAKWGLIPDMSGSLTLRELVRIDVAKELSMSGKLIDGLEAARLGLVTRCVEDPLDEALNVAREIATRSPDAVSRTKRLFQETWVADEQQCLDVETAFQKELLGSWNQAASSVRSFGWKLPYMERTDSEVAFHSETESRNNKHPQNTKT